MGDFELSDKQKDEFLNLPVIRDNFVNCWFEDQKLIMPSGQGKTLKGVVLASLEVFKIQQTKIDELQKRIDEHNRKLNIFIDELKKTHNDDRDNKVDFWRGFSECADSSVQVFIRDVGFID